MGTCRQMRSALASYAGHVTMLAACSKVVLVSLLACQLLFLLPMAAGYPTGSIAVDREMCRTNAYLVKDNLLDHGSEFPDDLLALIKQEYQHFFAALDAEYPSQEYFAELGRAREIEVQEQEAGYLTGGIETQAGTTLLKQLSELDNPQVYVSASELPAFNYLALATGVMPAATLLLPGILAGHEALRRLHGAGLFSVAPLGATRRRLGALLAALPLAALSPFAVSLPAALVALARNGIGNPAFPVVLIIDGSVVSATVLATLGKITVLLALSAAAAVLLMALIDQLDSKLSLGLGLLALVLPLMPFYAASTVPWHEIGRLLPATYLMIGQVIGYPTYANGLDISVFPGATFGKGVLVLLLSCAALLAGTLGTCAMASRVSSNRTGKGERHD